MLHKYYISKVIDTLETAKSQILTRAGDWGLSSMARMLDITASAMNNKRKGRRPYTLEELAFLAATFTMTRQSSQFADFFKFRAQFSQALTTLPVVGKTVALFANIPYYDFNRRYHRPETWDFEGMLAVEKALIQIHDQVRTLAHEGYPAHLKAIAAASRQQQPTTDLRKQLISNLNALPILAKQIASRSGMPYYHYIRRINNPDTLSDEELTRIGNAVKQISLDLDDFLEAPWPPADRKPPKKGS